MQPMEPKKLLPKNRPKRWPSNREEKSIPRCRLKKRRQRLRVPEDRRGGCATVPGERRRSSPSRRRSRRPRERAGAAREKESRHRSLRKKDFRRRERGQIGRASCRERMEKKEADESSKK